MASPTAVFTKAKSKSSALMSSSICTVASTKRTMDRDSMSITRMVISMRIAFFISRTVLLNMP